MAKISSAERVNPITRANHSGKTGGDESGAEYDPLAALANLVGNIENDAANADQSTAEEHTFDLESELGKDFQNSDGLSPQEVPDFNDQAYALDAGPPGNVNQGYQPQESVESELPVPAAEDEPVLQSLASLHTAFGVEPQVETQHAAPLVDALSDDAMLESQLLKELSIETAPQNPNSEITDSALPVMQTFAPQLVAESDIVPPIDQSVQYQQDEPSNKVAPALYPSQLAPAVESEPIEEVRDEAFVDEFNEAVSVIPDPLIDEPLIANAVVSDDPELVYEGDSSQHDVSYETLKNDVAMPSVSTPFDHQVDHAISDIIQTNTQDDSEIDWSGNLSEELQGIVSSSGGEVGSVASPAVETLVEVVTVEPDIHDDQAVAAAPLTDDIAHTYSAVDTRTPDQSFTETAEYSAFEQEFSDQLNPEFGDEPMVGIPDAPEFAETNENKRGGMGVAMGVLGVAAVVAVSAFSWNYFSSDKAKSSVPTLLASSDPVKIKPKEPGGVKVPNQDQVVFEKVNGKGSDKTSQERLASGTEAPIRVVTSNSASPVVQPLPVSNSKAKPAKSSARVAANDTVLARTEQAIISPRKVRTVIVRPDGTIVTAKSDVSANKSPKVKSIKVASTNKIVNFVDPVEKTTTGSIAKVKPLAIAKLPKDTSVGVAKTSVVPIRKIDIAPIKPIGTGVKKLRTVTSPVAKTKPKPVAKTKPKPVAKAKAQPVKKTVPTKKVKPASKPVKLATASTGGYVVQISSQRSAEAAQSSYGKLSRRYSSILGGKGVDIRRFKLKGKGIYYRVRIPAQSKKSAINLCTRYKSAGGSCFVTR